MDGMRAAALRSLGAVKEEGSISLLLDQVTDENPEIVRDAARALEEILGTTRATTRIVEATTGADGAYSIEDVVLALRWMVERDLVVEQLEDLMLAGHTHEQDTAKRLLSEIGGVAAFKRLQVQTRAPPQYLEALEQAEERVREQFTSSIEEARGGFRMAIAMDVTVFVIGIVLVAISATFAWCKAATWRRGQALE
jgi:HEAT repeat protein